MLDGCGTARFRNLPTWIILWRKPSEPFENPLSLEADISEPLKTPGDAINGAFVQRKHINNTNNLCLTRDGMVLPAWARAGSTVRAASARASSGGGGRAHPWLAACCYLFD